VGNDARSFVSCCNVGAVSLCPLAKLDAVAILKVKPSPEYALPRRRAPWKRATHHTAVVQALDTSGDMVLPGFLVEALFHPLAGRKSQIAQVDRTVPSSGERPAIHQGVTLNWKRLGAVQMGLAVVLPFEPTKDPLVTIETQLGPAACFGKILFVARIDMLPSQRG
jgi:hypothetical protein